MLATLAVVGLITIAAVAPGIGPALKLFGIGKKKPYPRANIKNAVSRLHRKGLIGFQFRDGQKYISLTEEGRKKLAEYENVGAVLKLPEKWDKKWRIVTFDIPEKARSIRISIRRELSRAGFIRLQDSVWIYPYECEEYVALLKAEKRIGKSLLYVVAERVEYDTPLKKLFNLP